MQSLSPLDQFIKWEHKIPNQSFLSQPFDGHWKTWTYGQAGHECRKIAQAILQLNLPAKSHIALLSKNCAHWIMADLAIMMTGHVSIPIYPSLTASSIQQILEHSDARAIIVGKLDNYPAQKEGIPGNLIRIGIAVYGIHETITWENILQKEGPLLHVYSWMKDDLLTIKYTSGTTGSPKGVMHRIEAFDTTAQVAIRDLHIKSHIKLFSYLPLSHIAERVGIEMVGLYSGGHFHFAESLDSFAENLAYVQPNIFFAVPRIWMKFREKILQKLPQEKLGLMTGLPIVGALVKKSIRKKLGLSKATHIYSGAAPISVELVQWFERIGVTIFQAYGMTEDCIYSHFNRHGKNHPGTVGIPLSGLQVRIAAEGEIRLKSTGNFVGYYKEEGLTSQAFDEDGYLKTGDKGEKDEEGFLSITGRIKDQFKTDKGKYISPAPIEIKILANTDLEQVCVVGTGIPQPIALVILSDSGKKKSIAEITQSLSDTLNGINPTLESYEQMAKAVILKKDWTIENGLLTPTLKVKRNEVEKEFTSLYNQWYNKSGFVLWE